MGKGKFGFMRIVETVEMAIGPIILFIIFADVFMQVLSRIIPGNAISWTVEVGEILLGALIWFGISTGVKMNSHVGFDLIVGGVNARWKKYLGIWNILVFIVYLVLLGTFTVELLRYYQKLDSKSTILRISMFWVRLPILLGCVMTSIRLVVKLVKVALGRELMYDSASKATSLT